MLKSIQDQRDTLACEISVLVYDKYLTKAYGLQSCNINYTSGDLIEKILVRSILDLGHQCSDFPKCSKEHLHIDRLKPIELTSPIFPLPVVNPKGTNETTVKYTSIGANTYLTYIQTFPATIWEITHDLVFNPNVTIVDSLGNVIEANSIKYIGVNQIRITFSIPTIGKAFLS